MSSAVSHQRDEFGADATPIDVLPFGDVAQSVSDDIATIRRATFIPDDIIVSGFIYEVATGRVLPVE